MRGNRVQEKPSEKKFFFSKFQKPLFLTGWSDGYHFWLVLRYSSVISKKFGFATLVKSYGNLIIKRSQKWNGF